MNAISRLASVVGKAKGSENGRNFSPDISVTNSHASPITINTSQKSHGSFPFVALLAYMNLGAAIVASVHFSFQYLAERSHEQSYQACTIQLKDSSVAADILKACNVVLDSPESEEDTKALIARAQANAVLGNYPEADNDFKKVFQIVEIPYNKEGSSFNSEERQVAFLKAFWPEFMSLVVDKSGRCGDAETVYELPLRAYRYLFTQGAKTRGIEEEELFPILELGHFVSDRDREWNLASELYDLILDDIDPKSINALLSKVHAHVMSHGDMKTPEDFLKAIENIQSRQSDIQAKVQYHRGSILARQEQYGDAAQKYGEILSEEAYTSALEVYPFLKFIALRDRAFALYASDQFSEADTVFEDSLSVLDKLKESGEIEELEYADRRSRIVDFQVKASSCKVLSSNCGSKDSQLRELIDYGSIFSHLISHETEIEGHAFFEKKHGKFYGCSDVES